MIPINPRGRTKEKKIHRAKIYRKGKIKGIFRTETLSKNATGIKRQLRITS